VLVVLFGTTFLMGNLLALLVAFYAYAFYPDENATPQNQTTYDAPFFPVLATVAVAFVVLAALAVDRPRPALAAFAIHAALVGLVLSIAVPLSAHSDRRILTLALAIEGLGAVAVLLAVLRAPTRRPAVHSSA